MFFRCPSHARPQPPIATRRPDHTHRSLRLHTEAAANAHSVLQQLLWPSQVLWKLPHLHLRGLQQLLWPSSSVVEVELQGAVIGPAVVLGQAAARTRMRHQRLEKQQPPYHTSMRQEAQRGRRKTGGGWRESERACGLLACLPLTCLMTATYPHLSLSSTTKHASES